MKKIKLGNYDPPEYETSSQAMGCQLLNVLVNEDKDEFILILTFDTSLLRHANA